MTDRKIKEFTLHLRRQLYLMKLLQYTNSCITEMSITPTFVKVGTGNLNNSIKRIMSDLQIKGEKGAWEAINADLNKDQLHDISLLTERVILVNNLYQRCEIRKCHPVLLKYNSCLCN